MSVLDGNVRGNTNKKQNFDDVIKSLEYINSVFVSIDE